MANKPDAPAGKALSRARPNPASPPVNKQTVLDKISFVRFGKGGLETHQAELKQDLYDFRNRRGITYISHPTIQNWCEKGHRPSRHSAFKFLSEYVTDLQKMSLSEARTKVRNQIAAFLKTAIESSERDRAIYRAKDGRYVLGLRTSAPVIERLASTIQGYYFTYRIRFGAQIEKPVARELLFVSLGHESLNFEHWHRRDDQTLIAFEGCVVPVGDILWFLGVNSRPANRLRVMHFRDTKGVGSRAGSLRWGILSSDVPQPSSEPASAHIVMYRPTEEFSDTVVAAERYVQYISLDELPEQIRPVMHRLLANDITSQSQYGTMDPARSEDGRELKDRILRVDQHTAVAATRKIIDLGGIEPTIDSSKQEQE